MRARTFPRAGIDRIEISSAGDAPQASEFHVASETVIGSDLAGVRKAPITAAASMCSLWRQFKRKRVRRGSRSSIGGLDDSSSDPSSGEEQIGVGEEKEAGEHRERHGE